LKVFFSLKQKVVLCGFLLFLLLPLHPAQAVPDASWDSTVSLDAGYPPSVYGQIWLGYYWTYNLLPLKRLDKRLAKFDYGYIRPHLRYLSSYKVNQIETRLDVYPSSFIGTTVGVVFSNSTLSTLEDFSKYSGFSCAQIQCDGWFYDPFIEAKFKFAINSRFFGVLFGRYDFPRADTKTAELMYDPNSSTVFDADYDKSFKFFVVGGVFLGEEATLSLKYSLIEWGSGFFKNEYSVLFNQRYGRWSVGVFGKRMDRSDLFDQWGGGVRFSRIINESPAAEERL